MTSKSDITRSLRLRGGEAGAYRVRLVGEDPSQVATALVSDRDLSPEVRLEPGRYTAFVENLSGTGSSVEQVEIAAGRSSDPIDLTLPGYEASAPLKRPSRPSRYRESAAVERSGFSGIDGEPRNAPNLDIADFVNPARRRQFCVGVSVDLQPDRRGGWVGEAPDLQVSQDVSTRGLVVDFDRPPDWRDRPRWRMTIAVEGDAAWRAPIPLFRGGLRVQLNPVQTASGPDVSVAFLPRDPRTAALIGSLQKLFPDETETILNWSSNAPADDAVGVLFEKFEDPWAAAAAALLLARNGEIGRVAHWTERLMVAFPWLPDGGVAVAWARAATAQRDSPTVEAECLSALVESRRRGAPYFAASNALALEMLTTLAMSAAAADVRDRARRERLVWARHSRRAMRTGAFLSWETAGLALTSGRLPPATYAVVAAGELSAEAISPA